MTGGNAWKTVLVMVVAVTVTSPVRAQITGDEGSASYLAAQCAVSSGLPVENFSRYGERLALTLSQLDAAQQERVFGFLPTPGGATVTMANAPGMVFASGADDAAPPGGEVGLLDQLLGGVTEMLQEFQQSENPATSIVAGKPPADTSSGEVVSSVGGESNPVPSANASGSVDAATGPENQPPADDDGNNGHGNSGGFDSSNPGKGKGKKTSGDDGNNGHGNSGGFDSSNPGKGKGKK